MKKRDTLDVFEEIIMPDPVNEVLKQFKRLISQESILPGDKLPSERRLEKKMNIQKASINKALRMMETYGIVNTIPQSGTYINTTCKEALEGLMMNLITLEESDTESIVNLRCVLEKRAVQLIIQNASQEDLINLQAVHESLKVKLISNSAIGLDDDMIFHIHLAKYTQSPVLASILTRQIVNMASLLSRTGLQLSEAETKQRLQEVYNEHDQIITAIINKNEAMAVQAIEDHLSKYH